MAGQASVGQWAGAGSPCTRFSSKGRGRRLGRSTFLLSMETWLAFWQWNFGPTVWSSSLVWGKLLWSQMQLFYKCMYRCIVNLLTFLLLININQDCLPTKPSHCQLLVWVTGSAHDSTAWTGTHLASNHRSILEEGEWVWVDSAYPVSLFCVDESAEELKLHTAQALDCLTI